MDKYEYNLRYDEIKELKDKGDYVRAVEIADTIDWTRVRSVNTLCYISDLYKINRRYKEARILLEQAYGRISPDKAVGKSIVYSLCEICIKMEDVVGATEYYKRFVQMAPTNNKKFVLLYKIYEAQDVSLEERIQVLEELKKREPLPKWWYELANLYHRIGLTTKCVEECDELILWFREGKYVKKAMELKMLHQQLTGSQEALYKNILAPDENTAYPTGELEQIPTEAYEGQEEYAEEVVSDAADYQTAPATEEPAPAAAIDADVRARDEAILGATELVKTVDVGQYSTINIQKALEESIKGSLNDAAHQAEEGEDEVYDDETKIIPGGITEALMAPMMQDTGEMEELSFPEEDEPEKEAEPAAYSPVSDKQTTPAPVPVAEALAAENKEEESAAVTGDTIVYDPVEKERIKASATAALEEIDARKLSKDELIKLIDEKVAYALENAMNGQSKVTADLKSVNKPDASKINSANPPRSMQKMLSQEYDGQISLVVPDQNPVEKQITGQIDIEDYLSDWEKSKKERNQRQEEKIEKLVSQHTDNLLADFDVQNKDSLLEKLTEEAAAEAEEDEQVVETEAEVAEETAVDTEETAAEAEAEATKEAEDTAEESDSEEVSEEDVTEETSSEDAKEEEKEESEPEEEPDPEDEAIEAEHIAAAEAEAEEDDSAEEETVRKMTEEEASLFSSFVQTKKGRRDLLKALDSISLASYVGNVCVTGQTGEESVDLAKNVVQYAKMTDSNFSGKIGKVSGSALNEKDMDALIDKLKGGGLIVEKAGDITDETAEKLHKALDQENLGILVVLQDSRKAINKLLNAHEELKEMFGVHIEIEELSDDALVAYGRKYAEKNEFSIDDMGILALHTRIDEMQTSDHIVTVTDVRELIDEAMEHATRFSPKHFSDILFGKRYDDDDMIILKERDFIA